MNCAGVGKKVEETDVDEIGTQSDDAKAKKLGKPLAE